MIVRSSAERPVVLSIRFLDRHVVDAGDTALHQAVWTEFPVLIAVRAEPVSRIIVPFIREPDRNAIIGKSPHLFD